MVENSPAAARIYQPGKTRELVHELASPLLEDVKWLLVQIRANGDMRGGDFSTPAGIPHAICPGEVRFVEKNAKNLGT